MLIINLYYTPTLKHIRVKNEQWREDESEDKVTSMICCIKLAVNGKITTKKRLETKAMTNFESLQYRQYLLPIIHYHNRKKLH